MFMFKPPLPMWRYLQLTNAHEVDIQKTLKPVFKDVDGSSKPNLHPFIHREKCPFSGRVCDVWLFRLNAMVMIAYFVPCRDYSDYGIAYIIDAESYYQDRLFYECGTAYVIDKQGRLFGL